MDGADAIEPPDCEADCGDVLVRGDKRWYVAYDEETLQEICDDQDVDAADDERKAYDFTECHKLEKYVLATLYLAFPGLAYTCASVMLMGNTEGPPYTFFSAWHVSAAVVLVMVPLRVLGQGVLSLLLRGFGVCANSIHHRMTHALRLARMHLGVDEDLEKMVDTQAKNMKLDSDGGTMGNDAKHGLGENADEQNK